MGLRNIYIIYNFEKKNDGLKRKKETGYKAQKRNKYLSTRRLVTDDVSKLRLLVVE